MAVNVSTMWSSMQAQVAMAMALAFLVSGAWCGPPKVPPGKNITATYGKDWLDAKATWYGKPTGAGPDDNGGGCGYKDVNKPPFNSMGACGNIPIFKDGLGCGSCFEIKCDKPVECSGKPVVVHITDMNYEPIAAYHFDLAGTAFGAMAKNGEEEKLRKAGIIDMQFRRVKCKYGSKVTFHLEKGCGPNYLALLVNYVDGDGDIVAVDVKEKGSDTYEPLKHSWGAIWRKDSDKPLKGPLTVRLTTEGGTKTVYDDVIPANWKANTAYTAK
ncbi:Expansin-B10 precursor [Zea mays]|jgi:hypothetical protein|uniref:Uncharacterized protein n=2 Tax=Zea mays TaxID=4577 RepID=B4FFK8_MAIZE|nr:Expansin-B10 precursor [Zea mays]ACF80901.1 unknown [Zea mays]|eukprot:NP_001132169.1 uncharacterized LOC100193591 precursor [Zea mays]